MLVSSKQLLKKAQRGKYAVPAFNINNLEVLQAVVEAAAQELSPVIVQTSEGALKYAGMEYLHALAKVASEVNPKIPIVFHLDHGKNYALVKEAINSGLYTSVMYDGSSHDLSENIRRTRTLVKLAHSKKPKIQVEAELGAIVGKEDFVVVAERQVTYTKPEEAAELVERTGCDSLAISIGTAHGILKFKGKPKLDFERLKKIRQQVKIPLVLHGASEIPEDLVEMAERYGAKLSGAKGVTNRMLKHSVRLGISKVNIDSDLRIAFDAGVRKVIKEKSRVYDPRKILGPAKELMKKEARDKMRLLGSSGKA
jgi:fructose-bisphosphate aldolase, class II